MVSVTSCHGVTVPAKDGIKGLETIFAVTEGSMQAMTNYNANQSVKSQSVDGDQRKPNL